MLHSLRERARRCAQHILGFVKSNGGRIAYYALVVVALCAIARAAEIYRADNAAEEALVLPAVDVLEVEEPAPEILLPEEWKLLEPALRCAGEAALLIAAGQMDRAMNLYNA